MTKQLDESLGRLLKQHDELTGALDRVAAYHNSVTELLCVITQAVSIQEASRANSFDICPDEVPDTSDLESLASDVKDVRSASTCFTAYLAIPTHEQLKRVCRRLEDDPKLGAARVSFTRLCHVALVDLLSVVESDEIPPRMIERLRRRRLPGEASRRLNFSLARDMENRLGRAVLTLNQQRAGAAKASVSNCVEVALQDFLPRLLQERVDAEVLSALRERRPQTVQG